MSETSEEEWRPVVGWEGAYEVSSLGRVRTLRRRRQLLSLTPNRYGYICVNVYGADKMKRHTVHALVAEAFIGKRPDGYHVAHGDGDRQNNSAANLRYATAMENIRDRDNHRRCGKPLQQRPTWDEPVAEHLPGEEWRPVVGWESLYEVSSLGRVRSLNRVICDISGAGSPRTRRLKGRLLALRLHYKTRYPMVQLYKQEGPVARTVHHLVAEAFIGPRPVGLDIAHNDGDPTNPAADNLRYASRKENMADCYEHGTKLLGEAVRGSKLNPNAVREIRSAKGITQRALADRYGVSVMLVNRIIKRKVWRHID